MSTKFDERNDVGGNPADDEFEKIINTPDTQALDDQMSAIANDHEVGTPEFNPNNNPAHSDYQRKFEPQSSQPQSHEASTPDNDSSFRYTGDKDRDALAAKESTSQKQDPSSAGMEGESLSNHLGATGGWKTSVGNTSKRGLKKFFSGSGKKKALAIAAGGGGIGGLVLFMFLIIPFLNLMSLEQMTTVMRTYRFANIHYSSYRRTTQYTVQESLDGAATWKGRLNEKLARYSPDRAMKNLTEEGVVDFVTKDGKTRWTRRPTSEITHIIVGKEWIEVPSSGVGSTFKQREFLRNIESAMSDADVLGGKSRYFRTKATNALLKQKGIKLNRWALKGRGIKTLADAVTSMYEAVKPKSRLKSSMPEVPDSADAFEGGLKEALEGVEDASDLGGKTADLTVDSVKKSSNGLRNFARGSSIAAMAATIYCGGRDYIKQQPEIAKSKGLAAMATTSITESAVSQAKYGDTTARAIDLEAGINSGFEQSVAYQRAVGVDPVVIAQKEADLDRTDSPVVDEESLVYQIFSKSTQAGDVFISGITAATPGLNIIWYGASLLGMSDDEKKDKMCSALNDTLGQIVLAFAENILGAVAGAVSGGSGTVATIAAREGAEAGVKYTFRQAMKKFLTREILGKAARNTGTDVASMMAFEYVTAFLMDKLMGTNSPSLDSGRTKSAKVDMGYKMLANEHAIALGGRELTATEVAEVKQLNRQTRLASLHKESLWNRLLSVNNPYSPVSQFAVSYPKSGSELIAKTRELAVQFMQPTKVVALAGTRLSSATIPQQVTFAATDEKNDVNEYNFPTIGFSVGEINRMSDDDFWPRENGEWMEKNGKVDELHEKYGVCYEILEPGEVFVQKDGTAKEKCTPEFLGTEEALRYRLYRTDGGYGKDSDEDREDYAQGTLGELLDLQEVTAAIGGGGGAGGGSGGTGGGGGGSVDGTVQELAQKILDNPNVSYTYTDTKGVTVRMVLEHIVKTGKGIVNSPDVSHTETTVSAKMLQTILEYAQTNKIGLNTLTNADHSSTSKHYSGHAFDIGCQIPIDLTLLDSIAKKYGGARNFETCDKHRHWHYQGFE